MNWKSLALISTSVVALGFSASASLAAPAPATTARIDMGFTPWWDSYDYGGEHADYSYTSLTGMARVNIPYNPFYNVQLDVFGDASLNHGYFNGKGWGNGNFGFGAHINYRDPSEGLIGIFAAVGRVWDIYSYNNSPAVMAGLEGQYYCGHWSLYGQAGYMDSDGYFQNNSGFVRALASYYASPKLKLRGGLAYIDGDYGNPGDLNATAWAWEAGGEYWFGKSVPVAVTLKYQGRQSEIHESSNYDLDTNEVTIGLSFFFGGGGVDSIEEADKNNTSVETPNFDWFRVAY